MMLRSIHGSRIASISPGLGQVGRIVDHAQLAAAHLNLVLHRWRGRQQVEVVLALQPFLDDLHVEQAEEAAAEPESERRRRFRQVGERRVVELEALERIAQDREILAVDRIESGEHHRLGGPVARQRCRWRAQTPA